MKGGDRLEPVVYTLSWAKPFRAAERQMLLALLPEARRSRLPAGRPELWDQPLAAWGLLALGLRELFGLSSVPEPAAEEGGKPWFPGLPEICFSLSHTRGAAACGLWNCPIGVDVERARPVSPRLLEQLGAADEAAFLPLWVCREAAAKRLGLGSVGALRRPVAGEELCQVFSPGESLLAAASAQGAVRWESMELPAFLERLGCAEKRE